MIEVVYPGSWILPFYPFRIADPGPRGEKGTGCVANLHAVYDRLPERGWTALPSIWPPFLSHKNNHKCTFGCKTVSLSINVV